MTTTTTTAAPSPSATPSATPETTTPTVTPGPPPTPEPEPTRTTSFGDCPDGPVFTVSPVSLEDLDAIVTLGNLNPPSHTFPTDHIYFYVTRASWDAPAADRVDFFAPGDGVVTGLIASEHPDRGFADYDVFLRPCESLYAVFMHVTSLDEAVFGDTSDFSGWDLTNEYETGGEHYRLWRKDVSITVRAGDRLGTAGGIEGGSWALDFGLYDTRVTATNVADPDRWREGQEYFHVVCPLAYYEPGPLLDALIARVDRVSPPGEEYPWGTIYYDVPGTAQGLWFPAGTEGVGHEDANLALVYSNLDPSIAVFSVGTSVPGLPSGVYGFTPATDGQLNSPFADITPDGQVYGYRVDGYDGTIIVAMPDEMTLRIEALPSAAADPAAWAFTDSAVTFER
jgi:hypothetical protein